MHDVILIGVGLLGIAVLGVMLFRWMNRRLSEVQLIPWLKRDGTFKRVTRQKR